MKYWASYDLWALANNQLPPHFGGILGGNKFHTHGETERGLQEGVTEVGLIDICWIDNLRLHTIVNNSIYELMSHSTPLWGGFIDLPDIFDTADQYLYLTSAGTSIFNRFASSTSAATYRWPNPSKLGNCASS